MMQVTTRTRIDVTTRQQSLQILKNTVSLGVSSVLYLRNIFSEDAFASVWFEGLKLVQLRPVDKKSSFLVRLLRTGVNEALQKECLQQLLLGIHEEETDALLESYEFTFGYGDGSSTNNQPVAAAAAAAVSVAFNKGSSKTTTRESRPIGPPVSKAEAKRQTEALLQSLCAITQQLDPLPDNAYVSLRLLFNRTTIPHNYVPKGFIQKIDDISFGGVVPFTAISEKINTKHHSLKLSIQSLADPPHISPALVGDRAAVVRIVEEVKAYILATEEDDIDRLVNKLGKNSEPFIAAALDQLRSSGFAVKDARERRNLACPSPSLQHQQQQQQQQLRHQQQLQEHHLQQQHQQHPIADKAYARSSKQHHYYSAAPQKGIESSPIPLQHRGPPIASRGPPREGRGEVYPLDAADDPHNCVLPKEGLREALKNTAAAAAATKGAAARHVKEAKKAPFVPLSISNQHKQQRQQQQQQQQQQQHDVMRAAAALIEQCKEIAQRKQKITKEEISSFCVVSADVAEELINKMLNDGLISKTPGRGKYYRSRIYQGTHASCYTTLQQQQHQQLIRQTRNSNNSRVAAGETTTTTDAAGAAGAGAGAAALRQDSAASATECRRVDDASTCTNSSSKRKRAEAAATTAASAADAAAAAARGPVPHNGNRRGRPRGSFKRSKH